MGFLGDSFGVNEAQFSKYSETWKNLITILLPSKLPLDPKTVDFRHSKTIRRPSNQCLKAVLMRQHLVMWIPFYSHSTQLCRESKCQLHETAAVFKTYDFSEIPRGVGSKTFFLCRIFSLYNLKGNMIWSLTRTEQLKLMKS